MALQDELDNFKKDFSSGKPPYNLPAQHFAEMERATRELIESGVANGALTVGDRAPAFTLDGPDRVAVSSRGLLDRGPLVLSFYRGVWCPYCNMELQALEKAVPGFRALGADLVAISPQTPVNSRRSVTSNNLTFPILSDPGNEVAAAFGLSFRLPDYLLAIYTEHGIDLAASNQDDSGTLPMPARFVIDQDGVIRYAEVNPDYTRRPDPDDLLPVLRQCSGVL